MLYHYVGPRHIAERRGPAVRGTPITSSNDLRRYFTENDLPHCAATVTFVVDEFGTLLIADRHSEHVACAGGQPVRAAGELCFDLGDTRAVVARVSNQSTGYCPEPESWPEVDAALRRAGLDPPNGFEPRCEFRRCVKCASLNLVKCGVFECAVCEAELPEEYNVQTRSDEPEV